MSYRDMSAQNRVVYPVPVKPVLEAVERWLEEDAKRSGWKKSGREGINSPLANLAERAGVSYSSFCRTVYRIRHESERMSMAQAERLIAATYGDEVWEHPELRHLRPKPARGREWMRPEERESVSAWKLRVVGRWTARERAEVGGAIASLLSAQDDSRPARHAKPGREREVFKAVPYTLERAFGAKARGEKAA